MMKSFFLVVNILALTLPFLGAEVPNQEQPACREKDERLLNQKTVEYIPVHYVLNSLNSSPFYEHNYYRYRPAVLVSNQNMPYPYYGKPAALRVLTQIPQWPILPIIYTSTVVRHPHPQSSLIAIPPKKIQDKTVIATINTIATVEPTLVPPIEPTVDSAVTPEALSEFTVTSTPETTTVAGTSFIV
ncbi:kappa-casein [Manis pentadactyla]|uniref:kappa-casein n=1 Tax=Manis pentadactyla TaxID=143292 RepID=UPI00255CADA6|nr:kappa-casein [Manis pentadactyla]